MVLDRRMVLRDDAQSATFAANRATGTVRFDVRNHEGVTRQNRLYEAGSLRVRFPHSDGDDLTAMLVNNAGGIGGGDRFNVAIEAGPGAQISITSVSAEKVYRSHGPTGHIDIALSGAAGSHICWLPQETIIFDQARVARSFDISLTGNASLLLGEMLVLGRTAMGEVVRSGLFSDHWRLRIDGRLVFAENVRLFDDIQAQLAQRAVANGGVCVGTALVAPADEALVDRIRTASGNFAGEVGISAWNGFAVARFVAAEAVSVRADMMQLLRRISPAGLPRMWMN